MPPLGEVSTGSRLQIREQQADVIAPLLLFVRNGRLEPGSPRGRRAAANTCAAGVYKATGGFLFMDTSRSARPRGTSSHVEDIPGKRQIDITLVRMIESTSSNRRGLPIAQIR
jgi:hypothetical protein